MLETSLCVYGCFVVAGIYLCNTGHFINKTFVYVCVVVEGMYLCKTGNFGNK